MITVNMSESMGRSSVLLLAIELGQRVWKLGFTVGPGQRPRIRQVAAGSVDALAHEISRATIRLKLSADAAVVSCFEAGRDGFWLHRWLLAHGVSNHVVDSASIEVNRRARRAKTDRLDLNGLLSLLARFTQGDRRVWRVVRVPTPGEEDGRHLQRTLETIQQDRTRLINRVKGLLATQGVQLQLGADFLSQVDAVRLWDGAALPDGIKRRLTCVWTQLEFLNQQLHELEGARVDLEAAVPAETARCIKQLQTLRAVGPSGAWVLATEVFGWRQIHNGRELGALAGLVPAPYQSGEISHDQGISRAGNRHLRRMMVQLAWGWLRYQPESALSRWYRDRFGSGRRMRRVGIVALARKLLIALWRYLDGGVIPEGATLKPIEA